MELISSYRLSVKNKECTEQLGSIKLIGTKLGDVCTYIYKNITCNSDTEKYRSLDGSCNNLETPFWGRSNTAYRRLLKADYDDGKLPTPREYDSSFFGFFFKRFGKF